MEKTLTKKEKNFQINSVIEFKKRMLTWDNPVEYVNNMYGCHPNDENQDYFKKVFDNGSE